jgi:hypothetical protein
MSLWAPFELLEQDEDDVLLFCRYPSDRDTVDAIFSSDENVKRHVIIARESQNILHTHYSHVCLIMSESFIVPLPCFILAHTDVTDLAAGVRRLLQRLGIYHEVSVCDLRMYDARCGDTVTLIDRQNHTHERAYNKHVDSDQNAYTLTNLVLRLDVAWRSAIRYGFSRRKAMDSVRRTIAASVAETGEPRMMSPRHRTQELYHSMHIRI